jgi:putative ABC transport system substrate-binding protein
MRRGKLIASLAATVRAFRVLSVIAAGLVSSAHEAPAQEPVHRIAVVTDFPSPPGTRSVLREELHARGYEVGRNLQIENHFTLGQSERIPPLVAEVVALRPEIIVAVGPQPALAVHAAAPTIPLVFIGIGNPVALGLVPNLPHPGGNVTGIMTTVPEDFSAKQLEFLKMVGPAASATAILINPTNPIHQLEQSKFPDIAQRLGVELVTVQATKAEELEAAFEKARASGVRAIDVFGDVVTYQASAKIANLTLQYRWPSIYLFRHNVEDGGLMSYGPDYAELWRSGASQIGKILKGTKPGDLPVEQPTRFDLFINLKTAKALGITVPATLLAQAAGLIE